MVMTGNSPAITAPRWEPGYRLGANTGSSFGGNILAGEKKKTNPENLCNSLYLIQKQCDLIEAADSFCGCSFRSTGCASDRARLCGDWSLDSWESSVACSPFSSSPGCTWPLWRIHRGQHLCLTSCPHSGQEGVSDQALPLTAAPTGVDPEYPARTCRPISPSALSPHWARLPSSLS